MALAVDRILLFYTGLSGAVPWSCLLDSGVHFTYRLFFPPSSLLTTQRNVHHFTQVPVIVKVPKSL